MDCGGGARHVSLLWPSGDGAKGLRVKKHCSKQIIQLNLIVQDIFKYNQEGINALSVFQSCEFCDFFSKSLG